MRISDWSSDVCSSDLPAAEVHAVELDPDAHRWAERNLAGTGVDLRLGDMATAFDDLLGSVDVVTCNPPYIPLDAWESVAVEARDRSEARRVGKECVSTCRSRWSPNH